ncbi:MAG: hypothetical protein NXH95_20320 [Pseudomonadaceae bacterium]|nr:hypothetical protein [Pseudomonadaceae bacterium]
MTSIATNSVEFVDVTVPEAIFFQGRVATIEFLSDELKAHPEDIHAILDDESEKVIFERGRSLPTRWPTPPNNLRTISVEQRRRATYAQHEGRVTAKPEVEATAPPEATEATPRPTRQRKRPSVRELMKNAYNTKEPVEEVVEAPTEEPADELAEILAVAPLIPGESQSAREMRLEREHSHIERIKALVSDVLTKGDHSKAEKLQEIYEEHFTIDGEAGEFLWKKPTRNGVNVGDKAGTCKSRKSAITISIKSTRTLRSKAIFAALYGVLPTEVKHVDGNPRNDSIFNLVPVFED